MVQLPTPLVFIGCLLSDPIPLSKRRNIRRATRIKDDTHVSFSSPGDGAKTKCTKLWSL